jgi:hypothetical protein
LDPGCFRPPVVPPVPRRGARNAGKTLTRLNASCLGYISFD